MTIPITDLQSNGYSKESISHPHANLEDQIPIAGVSDGGPAVHPGKWTKAVLFEYEVVPGFFIQNGGKGKQLAFDQILERHFGLIDSSAERWINLKKRIDELQSEAEGGVKYKVLFLGRHGQGWHNFAVNKHGVAPWEAKWTFLRGDGELTWGPDPALTPLGESQALKVYNAWKKEEAYGAPVHVGEMKWFVSPMTRACQTMIGSFGELLPKEEGSKPQIWEDWREIYGSHTCDERSSRTVIQERFPNLAIEEGFAEYDELWKPDERESCESMQIRGRRALDGVFGPGGAEEKYISITSHSEFLRNLLAVLDHQPYPLSTGEMIPVVVKATPVKQTNTINGTRNGTEH